MSEHRYHLEATNGDKWHTSCPHSRDELIERGWRLILTDEDHAEWECSHDGPVFRSRQFLVKGER